MLALEVDGDWLWLTGMRGATIAAMELWDDDAWHTLAERGVQVARELGALVRLQFALHSLARTHLLSGDLAAAARGDRGGARDRRGDRDRRPWPTPR